EKSNAIIIGEVWENAVLKESYGKRRKYLNSNEIDSTMNYPFRNAIINLVLKGNSAFFYNTVCDILHSYPQNAI
ncbi:MAG: glycoside hydrolase family 13 protein, partial [Oscillospiraceae bacterium]